MKERWVIFYDGACPLCIKAKDRLQSNLPNIKITVVNLNSDVAKRKGYDNKQAVLEAEGRIYKGLPAWVKILSKTKYKFLSNKIFRPFLFLFYVFITKNRKYIGKLLK